MSALDPKPESHVDLSDIKEIIELMKANDLAVFELEKDGEKLKLERPFAVPGAPAQIAYAPTPQLHYATSAGDISHGGSASASAPAGREIASPMVGTFYTAPSPDAGPFVTVGQEVTPDTVVCIIEAMKVMNEIKAETSGVVTEVVAENGKPVQFGQVLFRLK